MAMSLRVPYLTETRESGDEMATRLEAASGRLAVDVEPAPEGWLARVEAGEADCLLADAGPIAADDYALLERVRSVDPAVPVILTIGQGAEVDLAEALEHGASDYASLDGDPAVYDGLASRVENAARRYRAANGSDGTDGSIDPWEMEDTIEGPGTERNRRRIEEIFEELGTSFFMTDERGEYTYVNPVGSGITGYDPAEVVGSDPSMLLDSEDVERIYRVARALIRSDERTVDTVEARLERKDGERIPVEITIGLLTDEADRFRGTIGVMRDVTDRKETERRLRERRTVMQAVPDELAVIDTDGVIRSLMPPTGADRTMTGYDPETLEGEHVTRVLSDDAYESARDVMAALVDSERSHDTVEVELQCKDGGQLVGESHLAPLREPDGTITGVVSVLRDIEAHKQRERELERYETLLEVMPDTVVVTDIEARIEEIHGFDSWSGKDYEALVGTHIDDAITEESVERAIGATMELLEDDERMKDTFEVEIETEDGDVIPFEDHLSLLPPDESGEVPGTMSVLRNIEERKQRERELQRYASLVEASGDAVYALDPEGRFTFSNEAHQEIVDRPESEIIGAHASIALPDEAVEDGRALIADLLESGRRQGTFEMDVLRPDGERIPTENHVALLTDADGEFRGTVGVLRNISERLERERELERQNERLEEFASITSHDLRNPLNLAQGYLDLIAGECDTDHVETVEEALSRMERLIDDTLTWARQGATVESFERIELASLAPACWEAVGAEAGALRTVDDVTVTGDPDRVRRLFENLLRNAVEHGGEDVHVEIGAIDDGFYVADDGPGIPADERETVFEAGHTTASDGTGFGLAIVAEIVEAHGWDIRVFESEDGGARFEVTGVDVLESGAAADRQFKD